MTINGTTGGDSLGVRADLVKSMSLELEKDLAEENDHLYELVSATRYFKLIVIYLMIGG